MLTLCFYQIGNSTLDSIIFVGRIYLHLQSNNYGCPLWMPLMEEAKEEGVLCTFAKTTQVPRSITIKFTLGTYSQKRLHFCVHKPPVAFYLHKGQE